MSPSEIEIILKMVQKNAHLGFCEASERHPWIEKSCSTQRCAKCSGFIFIVAAAQLFLVGGWARFFE